MSGEDLTNVIPDDDKPRHFGGRKTETTLALEPGEHSLRLLQGDWGHMPQDPPITSEMITSTVE